MPEFDTWKNKHTPFYLADSIYTTYVSGLSVSDKKDLAWDDYIKTATGISSYEAWRNVQDVYQTSNSYKVALSFKVKEDYANFIDEYAKNALSDTAYNAWNPWYIKTQDQYNLYARNALELDTTSSPLDSTLYFRYMAARYKEDDVFYVGNSYAGFKNYLWATATEQIGLPISKTMEMFRNSKIPLDASLALQQNLVAGKNPDGSDASASWYRGGYTERRAHEYQEVDYGRLANNDKKSIARDIMQSQQNVFLDIATRYPKYHLDTLSNWGLSEFHFGVKKLFSKKWLSEFSDSNLEAYYAYRDKFIDNSNTERTKVTPFSDASITTVARSLSESEKQTIYRHTKLMNGASTLADRRTHFFAWSKNTKNKYSPILINHYFNNDGISRSNYDAWTPYWLHSKEDYNKIFNLDESDIVVVPGSGETPLSKLAETKHIALIKFFTIQKAQSQLKGNAPEDKTDKAQSTGQKFWNTIWWSQQNEAESHRLLADKIYLWKSLYNDQYFNLAEVKSTLKDNIVDHWKDELIAFEYFAYIIKEMEEGNDIDFDSTIFDSTKFRLSKQIIDYDKTKAKQPFTDYANFKTTKKDDLWTNIYLSKTSNWQSDYDIWKTAMWQDPANYGSAFQKWSKIIPNGEREFLGHSDSTASLNGWTVPTVKLESEYDILIPTWDNAKVLWAKISHQSWLTNTGHFRSWLNSKKEGDGSFSDQFIAAYRLEPIGLARNSLDVDSNYTKAEASADINNDFNNKAWWIIKYYIDETTSAPADFATWASLYDVPARSDLFAVIDADGLESEINATYKAANCWSFKWL